MNSRYYRHAFLACMLTSITVTGLLTSQLHAQRPGFSDRGSFRRQSAFTARGVGLGARSANLKETLETGLKTRRPSEFAFVERVVQMVNQNRLPLELVQSSFDWARHKRPFPYPYFERALKVRAARIGIAVQ